MNKPYMHTTSLAFLVSKMDLTTLLAQLVSISRAKWNIVMKSKNCMFFQLLGRFSQNVHFSGCDIFSYQVLIQSTQFCCGSAYVQDRVFDEAFFFLATVAMITESVIFLVSLVTIVRETFFDHNHVEGSNQQFAI